MPFEPSTPETICIRPRAERQHDLDSRVLKRPYAGRRGHSGPCSHPDAQLNSNKRPTTRKTDGHSHAASKPPTGHRHPSFQICCLESIPFHRLVRACHGSAPHKLARSLTPRRTRFAVVCEMRDWAGLFLELRENALKALDDRCWDPVTLAVESRHDLQVWLK